MGHGGAKRWVGCAAVAGLIGGLVPLAAPTANAETFCTSVWIGPATGAADWVLRSNWSAVLSASQFPASDDTVCFGAEFGGTAVDGLRVALPDGLPGITAFDIDPAATVVFTSDTAAELFVGGDADFGGVFTDGAVLGSNTATIGSGRTGGVLPGSTASSSTLSGSWTVEPGGELHLGSASVSGLDVTNDGLVSGVQVFASTTTIAGRGSLGVRQLTLESSRVDLRPTAGSVAVEFLSVRSGTTIITTNSAFDFVDVSNSTVDWRGGGHSIRTLTTEDGSVLNVAQISERAGDVFVRQLNANGTTLVSGGGNFTVESLDLSSNLAMIGGTTFSVDAQPESSTANVSAFITETSQVRVLESSTFNLRGTTTFDIGEPSNTPLIIGDNVDVRGCVRIQTLTEWADGDKRILVRSNPGAPATVDARLRTSSLPFGGGEWAFRSRPNAQEGSTDEIDIIAQTGPGNPDSCDAPSGAITATAAPVTLTENADATDVDVAFTNSTGTEQTATIALERTGAQPIEDGDVAATSETVVIPNGDSTQTIRLEAPADATFEGDETGRVAFTGTTPTVTGGIDVTVIDTTPRPNVVATPSAISALEGDNFVFTLSTSAPSEIPVVAPIVLLSGGPDAADPTDFVGFPATVSSADTVVLLSTFEDNLPEGDEAATVAIDGVPIELTILDDDQAAAGLTLTGPTEPVAEGSTARYTLNLPAPAPAGMSVTWRASFRPEDLSSPPADLGDLAPLTGLPVRIPAGASSLDFDLPITDDDDPEVAEAFLVTADVDGLILDPSIETTIAPSDGPVVDDDSIAVAQLVTGMGSLPLLFEGWGDLFDMTPQAWGTGNDPLDLPVVTDRLGTFGAVGDASRASSEAIPRPLATDTLEQAAQRFDDPDGDGTSGGPDACEVLFVARGVGGRPVATGGEIIRVRCVRDLGQLARAAGFTGDLWNDTTGDVLAELADALDLDATGDLTLDTTVEVTFGVDIDGFYVVPLQTGISAIVHADLDVSGSGDVVGLASAAVAGTAAADVSVELRPRGGLGAKLRLGELTTPAPELLELEVDGGANADLSITDGANSFAWSGSWSIATTPGEPPEVTTGPQRLRLLLQLDGLSTGTVDAPDVVELNGVLASGVWRLDGSLSQAAIGGFRITDADFDATVDATGIVDARASAKLILDDRDPDVPVFVDVTLVVETNGWRLSGQGLFGNASLLGLVELDDAVVDVLVVADGDGVGGNAQVTADRAVVFPDSVDRTTGLVVATDVTGRILGDGSVSFTASSVVGNVAEGAVQFQADAVDVAIGPAFADRPALVIDEAVTATFANLPGTTVSVTRLTVLQDGRVGATSASVDNQGGVLESAGLGGILPFDVTDVTLDFDQVIDGVTPPLSSLDSFDVSVTGSLDQGALAALPVTPRIQLGGTFVTPTSPPEENAFTFSVSVDSLRDGVLRPLDLGPIGIGFDDIAIGDVTLGADITLTGFAGGVLQPGVSGTVRIDDGFENAESPGGDALEVDLGGLVTEGLLDLDADFSFSADRGGLRLDGLSLGFGLQFGIDATGVPFLRFDLGDASLDSLRLPLGPFAVGTIGDVDLDFDPTPGDPILTIGGNPSDPTSGLGIGFLPEFGDLAGWGGRAGGLAVCPGGSVHLLPDAFFSLVIPPGAGIGLPPEVPVRIDEAGLVFDVGPITPDRPCDGGSIEGLTDVRVRVSGGVVANESFPLSFALDGIEISLARLTGLAAGFPIVNLDGIEAGMTPQEIAPGVRLGGTVGFGTVPVGEGATAEDVWYAQVSGLVGVGDIEFGGTTIVTEYGPVLISLTSPVGIPLGPTGLVLSSVSGGVRFNTEVPSIDDPTELLNLPLSPIATSLSRADIIEAVEPAVLDGVDLWTRPFSIAASGHITSIASPGMAGGDVTVGMNIGFEPGDGVKLFLTGDITAFGIDVGGGGALIDFSSPIEPLIDVAFALPGPSAGPLSFLMPAEGTFAMRIDTKGVAPAAAIALRTFVQRVATGTLSLGNAAFDAAARDLAADLDEQRHRPLAIILLDTNADGVVSATENAVAITPELLANRLFALLPATPAQATTLLTQRPELLTTVIGELLAGLEGVAVDGTVDADLVDAFGESQRTLAAFVQMVSESLQASGAAALAVFDPSLTIDAQLQPIILGIPFGEPEAGTRLRIDRTGLTVGFTISVSALSNRLANSIIPVVGGGIQSLLSLGVTDSFQIDAQLPFGGFVESLVTGTLAPRIDPDDGRWGISGSGRFGLFGYQSAGADLVITPPDNERFVRDNVQLLFDEATGAPLDLTSLDIDPNRIPITSPEHFADLVEFGGILIGGRLQLPGLLIDPVEVVERIGPAPETLDDTLGWIRQAVDTAGEPATPLRFAAFYPSPERLIVQQLDAIGDDRFSFDTGRDSFTADARDWLGAAFFDGVFDGTLLSLPVAKARVEASIRGIEVSGQVPLVGVDGTFVLNTRDQDVGGGVVVPLPTADLRITVDPLDRTTVFSGLGLPDAIGLRTSTMTVRAVSPGFDPASTDRLERQGGFRLSTRGDLDGLVDDARLDVGLFVASNPLAGPDFDLAVGATQLGPFAGVTITAPRVTMSKVDSRITGAVSGRATVLGATGSVSGVLDADLTGTFDVAFDTGQVPSLAGFAVAGAASITTIRQAGVLRSSIGITGSAQLPAWLATAGGAPTAQIGGCVDTNGNIEALIAAGQLGFGPSNASGQRTVTLGRRSGQSAGSPAAACQLPASTPAVPATSAIVRLRRAGGVTSVFVDGQLTYNVPGSSVPQMGGTGSFDATGRGSLSVAGTLPLLGTNLTVGGTLAIDPTTGPSASLGLTTPPGQPLRLAGFAVGGNLALAISPLAASVSLTNGTVTIPGASALALSGSLSTVGTGSLAVGLPTGGLRLGGSSSPFFVTGDFALGFASGVGTFSASGASLSWRDGTRTVATFRAPTFRIASDGSLAVDLDGFDFTETNGFALVLPDVDASAGPGLSAFKLTLSAGSLSIPGIADGAPGRPRLATPAIDIDTTASFRRELASGDLPLGLLSMSGKLVLEGDNGVFRLAVEPSSLSQPARLTIAGLGSLTASGTQFIASDGTLSFRVGAAQLGPAALSIRNASALVQKTGTSFTTLRVLIDGGQLFLPVGAPIELPDIDLDGSTRIDEVFTIPAIDLGPAFRTTSAQLRLQQLTSGTMRLDLQAPASVNVLVGPSMTLNSFSVDTAGGFSGSITGRLELFDRRLASATFDVSRVGSTVRVTLPTSRRASVNLGFATLSLSGFASSDGRFSFTGSVGVDLDIAIASLTGSVAVTVADDGISGSWDGRACVFAVGCASADGTMDSSGFVDARVGFDLNRNGRNETFFDVSFQLGTASVADTIRPSMSIPSNLTVSPATLTNNRARVNYTTPTSTDAVDGAVPTICSPASGTDFVVGATTVTCRATDRAGNTRTRTFTVTVIAPGASSPILTLAPGASTIASGGGFLGGTTVRVMLFSEPRVLAVVTADANGVVSIPIAIPDDLPLGEHTIVLEGLGADELLRQVTIPITVAVIDTPAPQLPVPQAPAGPNPNDVLPATGSSGTPLLVAWATLLVLAGCILLATDTSRRRLAAGATRRDSLDDGGCRRRGGARSSGRRP